MPALPNGKWEAFCRELSNGQTAARAYVLAGYTVNPSAASRLFKKPEIQQRLREILERKVNVEVAATERAIQRLALSKEALAREWLPLATSNMRNYVEIDRANGLLQFDFRDVTDDQWKAVKAVQIETRTLTGNGDPAKGGARGTEVAKVKFWLYDKVEAGMAIAKLFSWIDAPQRQEPPTPLEQRLRAMTPDQREQEAREFYRRVEQRLLEAEASGEGGIGNVSGNVTGNVSDGEPAVEPTDDSVTDEEVPEDGGT